MAFIRDGFSTTLEFAEDATAATYIIEKTVTPVGMDGGGMIDITGMRNSLWRTRISKSLVTLSDMTLTVQWDPSSYTFVFDMLNVNQLITINFPDGSELTFAGWISNFQPNEHKEGEEPLATITIIPSNINPADGTELSPAYLP